jgi:hypothetical protein
VRSYIRKSRLQQEQKLARLRSAMRPPERPLKKEMDLSWLPVSDAVRVRLRTCKPFIILKREAIRSRNV